RRAVAFVHMEAARQQQHLAAAERAADELAAVALDTRRVETGDLRIRHAGRILHAVGEAAESRTQHDRSDRRLHAKSRADGIGGGTRGGASVRRRLRLRTLCGAHAALRFSAAISPSTRASSAARSASGRNAFSKPPRARRQSSSKLNPWCFAASPYS